MPERTIWDQLADPDPWDQATPLFWETVHAFATRGKDIKPPAVAALPPAPIGVQIAELKQKVAGYETQWMPVVKGTVQARTIFGAWSDV